jgi:chromosome segregation ATPase
MGHSSIERRLRDDISDRHILRNEIRRKRSLAAKLAGKLERAKKKRLNNRYSATVERLSVEAEELERELNEVNLDLQKRIMDEIEFSEKEIQSFTDQYEKEQAEIAETESKLKAIEEGTEKPDDEEEDVPSKGAIAARTRRMLSRERRIMAGIQKELSSEERDRMLFKKELQQIAAELRAYKAQ